MGFKLAAKVYEEVRGTSGIAQTVLAYLAFRADDRTKACYPSKDTIIACTHHSESAVKRALNELRDLKILDWVPGGRKKGGGGRSVANSYFFNFAGAVDNSAETVDKSEAQVPTAPLQESAENPCRGPQRTPIIINQNNIKPVEIGGEVSPVQIERMASAQLGQKWRQENTKSSTGVRTGELGMVEMALRACHVNDMDNRRVFSSIMMYKEPMSCRDVINAFESECRQGENRNVKKSLAALLTYRLKQLPDIVSREGH